MKQAFSSLKAFIFDLDGTLVDSNELHVASWDRAFRHFGKSFPLEALRAQIGKGSDQYLPEFLSSDEITRFGKDLDQYRSNLFKNDYLPFVQAFPRVRELFEFLRNAGKRIALATSGKKEETAYYTRLLRIDDLIDHETCADDANHSKPAPDILCAALGKLEVPADACMVVGDTRFDVEAARRADLATVGLLCGGTPETVLLSAGAVAIYRDPAHLFTSVKPAAMRSEG